MSLGITPKLIADLRRRSAIEAEIGHMKTDGRLSRSPLKGTLGDALFATLCGCGHNIRKILAYLRAFLALVIAAILSALRARAGTKTCHRCLIRLFRPNSLDPPLDLPPSAV